MKFKKGNKVYNLAEAIFEYCKTAECSFCSICDAVKYTCGNEAKDLADLMGFEVIDEPTIGEIVAKHSEDAKPKRRTLGASNSTDGMAKYVEKYLEVVKPDPVNRPVHYTSEGVECIDAMAALADSSWQDRMKKEYRELKERYEKLHRMVTKYEAGTINFTPNCPIDLLRQQKRHMGEYLHDLEIRAEIEGIELWK
jgi:hypothetical protein